jgi:CxxC-x17-CxxC domain-containing protein
MGDFNSFNRDSGDRRSRGNIGGRNNGGRGRSFGGNRGGSRGGFGGRDRKPLEKFDAVCAKCGKDCQVPFKPSGNKPVHCSDCFEKQGNTRSGDRNNRSDPRGNRSPSSQGVTKEEFKQLSQKVDQILEILNSSK